MGKVIEFMFDFGSPNAYLSYKALQFNPHFPINALTLMRGAIAAAEDEVLERYIDAGLAAMWESGLKMDDHEIFVVAMNEAGLNGQALLE